MARPTLQLRMPQNDYYQTLGVERGADAEEIRKAYRKLARKHHPDLNPGDKSAEDRFKKVQEAYDILSEPKKKQMYDQYGFYSENGMPAGGPGGAGGAGGGAEYGLRRIRFFGFSRAAAGSGSPRQRYSRSGGIGEFSGHLQPVVWAAERAARRLRRRKAPTSNTA